MDTIAPQIRIYKVANNGGILFLFLSARPRLLEVNEPISPVFFNIVCSKAQGSKNNVYGVRYNFY